MIIDSQFQSERNEHTSSDRTSCAFVTTVYNGAEFIERAIKSGLTQTYDICEYIVVDDGSTDTTVSLVSKLADSDDRIRVFEPGRIGRAAALNYGIFKACSDLIFIQDADDFSFSTRVEKTVEQFLAKPAVGVVSTGYLAIDLESNISAERVPKISNAEILAQFSSKVPLCHTASAFRKIVWEEAGGYPEHANGIVDMPFWLAVAKTRWRFRGVPETLVAHHYYRASNFHSMFKQRRRALLLFKYNIYACCFIKFAPSNLLIGFLRMASVLVLPARLRWKLRGSFLRKMHSDVKLNKND